MAPKTGARTIKMQLTAGKANPASVGTVLGPTGINMGEFCQRYNDQTKDRAGDVVPAVIKINEDRSYSFELKTSPAAVLLKKAAGISTASTKGNKEIVATITVDQLKAIAEEKMEDLNANDIVAAMKIIAGTAYNMGIKIDGDIEAVEGGE